MIRLGARLAVSGGREALVRLLLTAIGVGVAATLLLLATTVDPVIRAHQKRQAWQYTGQDQRDLEGDADPLLWQLSDDVVAGRELLVLRVAGTGPGAPVPLGLPRVPEAGEVFVSAPLGELLDDLPADRLADRFPSPPVGRVPDRYLGGPNDLVAVVGVEESDLAGLAGVFPVRHVRTAPAAYQFTDLLRLVLGIGAVGLLMPVLVFVSTSTRIGAARREQRLAALRLAGATPRQTSVVAAVEAGAAAASGVVLGALGLLALRGRVAGIEIDGHPSFAEDVQVHRLLLVAVLVGVPVLAVGASLRTLRRLQISPLGVARRAVRERPTVRRLVPLAIGGLSFLGSLKLASGNGGPGVLVPVMASFALLIYGIVAAGPWCTVLVGRGLRRWGRGLGPLLAGRRLEDDPAAGFRAASGLVLAVFVASVFSGLTPALLADNEASEEGLIEGSTMGVMLPEGTSPDAADDAATAATAAGASDPVVLREDPDPGRPLADPAAGRGDTWMVTCEDLDRLPGTPSCPSGDAAWLDSQSNTVEVAPYSVAEVAVMPAALLVLETHGDAETTDRIRTAVSAAAPGAMTWLGSERAAEANSRLVQLNRLANVALVFTMVVAGCGLAVAVAGGILERQRPFALLRLSGVHLRELQRVALLEAAAPLLLIAGVTAALGLGTAALILSVAGQGIPWKAPAGDYWLTLVAGLLVAVAVAAAALPMLGRTTAPTATRFE